MSLRKIYGILTERFEANSLGYCQIAEGVRMAWFCTEIESLENGPIMAGAEGGADDKKILWPMLLVSCGLCIISANAEPICLFPELCMSLIVTFEGPVPP